MYIPYVCRYGIGCPNLVCSLYIFQRKLIGQSQLAGDARPACQAQPELPPTISSLIKDPKLGNKEINTYKISVGTRVGEHIGPDIYRGGKGPA